MFKEVLVDKAGSFYSNTIVNRVSSQGKPLDWISATIQITWVQ